MPIPPQDLYNCQPSRVFCKPMPGMAVCYQGGPWLQTTVIRPLPIGPNPQEAPHRLHFPTPSPLVFEANFEFPALLFSYSLCKLTTVWKFHVFSSSCIMHGWGVISATTQVIQWRDAFRFLDCLIIPWSLLRRVKNWPASTLNNALGPLVSIGSATKYIPFNPV